MSSKISPEALQSYLSEARLARYAAQFNGEIIVAKYLENLKISAEFYVKLHWLEIGLRNAIHHALAKKYGKDWLENGKINLGIIEQGQIAKARQTLEKLSGAASENDMVAALSFGFWVNLFNNPYENLWRTCLRSMLVNCHKGLPRKEFRKMLHPLLTLRNRVAHYEPILFMDLPEHKKVIDTIVHWLSDDVAQFLYDESKKN